MFFKVINVLAGYLGTKDIKRHKFGDLNIEQLSNGGSSIFFEEFYEKPCIHV